MFLVIIRSALLMGTHTFLWRNKKFWLKKKKKPYLELCFSCAYPLKLSLQGNSNEYHMDCVFIDE